MNNTAPHAAEARLLSADLTAPEDMRAAHSARRTAEAGEDRFARTLARIMDRIPAGAEAAEDFLRRCIK